ncbi:aminodeoxychorismate/anthranilate synthase component II [Parvularcula sp. ZS-1/3]|uniref:Aminodeoxychorismate/anthranilate synthase component II n=1 Tax=Parvularcula mediterranea TaxID=2732508 RepID=A0A7Y3W5G3_9PROT|nr:aminodeoxychorismate/anthranilate synthase component II [Parvularcula mediterranea]NNU16478.1 aminodeoxychorismate/anthranilate synthase component II [Parvularcula mediterranea]
MILVIDNYDSFVETLARYVREAGHETEVVRNDRMAVEAIAQEMKPGAVILSPGPYAPDRAGVSRELPQALPETPILGVCLGHLAIAEAYGGKTVRARIPMHGRASGIRHEGDALFKDVPCPFEAGRYHALVAAIRGTELVPTAWSDDGELMAFRHPDRPHVGVQFHPESLLTPEGRTILGNFLQGAEQ